MTLKSRIAKIEAFAPEEGPPPWVAEGRTPTFFEGVLWLNAKGIALEDLILASMDLPFPNSAKLASLERIAFA